MRIHRPKLKMPHPFAVAAFAMIWPLAMLLTVAAMPTADTSGPATKGAVALQTVEVQADKLWRQVSAVPERIRAHLRNPHNEGAT